MSASSSAVSWPGPALTPLGRLVVVAIVVCGLARVDVPPLIFAGTALAVLADGAVALLRFRPFAMTATMPALTVEGQGSTVQLRHPQLREHIRFTIDHDASESVGQPVNDRETVLTITTPGRGVFHALAVHGVLVGPLGLSCVSRRWVVPLADGHAGLPRSEIDEAVQVQWRQLDAVDDERRTTTGPDRLRPYRAGESMRAVHWPTSVRHGELLVRETDESEPILIRMAVDLGSWEFCEQVARTAMAIGTKILNSGDRLELEIWVPTRDGDLTERAKPVSPYRQEPLFAKEGLRLGRLTTEVISCDDLGIYLAFASPADVPIARGLPWPATIDSGFHDVIVRPALRHRP